MTAHLCISARFIDPSARPAFHGRADGGAPEWPPSSLRLFQALVAASAARFGNLGRFRAYTVPAFEWLAGLHPPTILAPPAISGQPFRTAVPNNDMDVVAREWARRVEPAKQPAALKTLKGMRSTYLIGDGEFPAIHYLWEIADADRTECERHNEVLFAAARDIVALGWGTDMAIGWGRMLDLEESRALSGQRWEPAGEAATTRLRVPAAGTFGALVDRYAAFLNRLGEKGFVPVPPLTSFGLVGYRRPTETLSFPFIAFELRTPDFERFQPYAPTRYTCAVAGMVRNALAGLAKDMRPFGWADEQINTFVHGHTGDGEAQAHGPGADRRFAYLPLPSLERRGSAAVLVTAIRRVLVVSPPGGDREIAWARVLSGRELVPSNNGTPPAALRLIDRSAAALRTDPNLRPYVGEARVWSTVTPVVLPGHDEADSRTIARRLRMAGGAEGRRRVLDQAAARTERLLRRAFEQAGIPPELVRAASLEWRPVGFRAGVDLATHYDRPEPCRLPRYHVRVKWTAPIRGPLFVGAARYRGLGIFVNDES